jgi:hypothetical protein
MTKKYTATTITTTAMATHSIILLLPFLASVATGWAGVPAVGGWAGVAGLGAGAAPAAGGVAAGGVSVAGGVVVSVGFIIFPLLHSYSTM